MTRGSRLLTVVGLAISLCAAAPAWALTLTAAPAAPTPAGDEVELTAQASGEGALSYEWDFGDGETTPPSADATVHHTYEAAGHYPVKVRVEDVTTARSLSFVQTIHWPLADGTPLQSSTIVYDAARRRVYQVEPDNNAVAVIDADTYALIGEVPVYRRPSSLALAPDGRLWVVHEDDYALAVIDLDALSIVQQARLPYASQPVAVLISPTQERAYVSLRATGHVVALDLETLEVVGDVEVGAFPQALATNYDESRLFVTRFISPEKHGEIYVLDLADFQPEKTIELAIDPGPDSDLDSRGVPNYLFSLVASPDGRSLWATGKKDNIERGFAFDGLALEPDNSVRSVLYPVSLDDETELLEQRRDQDNRSLPSAAVSSALGDLLFVSFAGNNVVDVLDAYSGKKLSTLSSAGLTPLGMALTPDGKLFVDGFMSRSVSVFDVNAILLYQDFAEIKLAEVVHQAPETLDAQVLQGKRMFYNSADARMSSEGYLSCGSCHFEGFEDARVWDFTSRGEGLRNTTSLQGRRGTGEGRLHWSGNFDELQDFENDIRNAFGGTGFLSDADWTAGTHSQTLGNPKSGLSDELDALAAYAASLDHVSPSPFKNADGTLSDQALAGEQVFLQLGCDGCHAGADFTDSAEGEVHDVGTILPTSGSRLGEPLVGLDTPTLLAVWQTAPYLHDGSAKTLRDVLTTKNPEGQHGDVASLTEQDLSSLERYLLELDSNLPVVDLPAIEPSAVPTESGGAGGASTHADAGEGGTTSAPTPDLDASPAESNGCACSTPWRARTEMGWLVALLVVGVRFGRRGFR